MGRRPGPAFPSLAERLGANTDQRWRDEAKCIGAKGFIFHPEQGHSYGPAYRYCLNCPVRNECAEDDLARPKSDQFGMRGGLIADERKSIQAAREVGGDGTPMTEHGTKKGFDAHIRNGEIPCDECFQGWIPMRPQYVVNRRGGKKDSAE